MPLVAGERNAWEDDVDAADPRRQINQTFYCIYTLAPAWPFHQIAFDTLATASS